MDLELDGKIVLVTGASRGLGRCIASRFVAEGCVVIGVGRSKDSPASETAKVLSKDGVAFYQCDVTERSQCQSLIELVVSRYGDIDVLVCNAGNSESAAPGEEAVSDWNKMLAVNLIGVSNMVSTATNSLKNNDGSIVCVSSICGLQPIPGAPITYSSAKAALNSYVRGSARHLAENGIRINGVAPGNLMFPGSVWARKQEVDPKLVSKMLNSAVPMKRLGKPEEISDVVLFLSSVRASFITGTIVPVDGGQVGA